MDEFKKTLAERLRQDMAATGVPTVEVALGCGHAQSQSQARPPTE